MFAESIIKNPSGYVNWVLCFVSLVMIFTTWFNTFRVKKYLMRALKSLEDDKYRFSLYDDCFKIETVFTEEEKAAEDFVPVKPRSSGDSLSVSTFRRSLAPVSRSSMFCPESFPYPGNAETR